MRVFRPDSEQELGDWLADNGSRLREGDVPVVTGAALRDPPRLLGAVPRQAISTVAFAQVTDFRPSDLTITVGAGMRLAELHEVVHEAGLWLPLAGTPGERSVGGWVAAAPSGEFDASFGPVRRHLLGCTLVLWDGRITRWGRPVMKNVAGYDVPRLVCGSRGKLGVLAGVTLRLWPRPTEMRRFDLKGFATDEACPTFEGAPRLEAVLWRRPAGAKGQTSASVFLASGPASVSARADALARWAEDRELECIQSPGGAGGATRAQDHRSPRPSTSAAYRITLGRRYLTAGVRGIEQWVAADSPPWTLEALPATGVIRLLAERRKAAVRRQAPAWLTAIADTGGRPSVREPALETPAVRIERGGPAEHEAARRMRSPAAREIERRWIAAFAGVDVPWQADYV